MKEKPSPFVLEFTDGKKKFEVEIENFPVSDQEIRELVFKKYKNEITHLLSSKDVWLESHSLTIKAQKDEAEMYSREQLEGTHLLNLFEVKRSLKDLTEAEAQQALVHLKSVLQNNYGWSAHDILNDVAKGTSDPLMNHSTIQIQYLAKSLTKVINPTTQDILDQTLGQDFSEENDTFVTSNR